MDGVALQCAPVRRPSFVSHGKSYQVLMVQVFGLGYQAFLLHALQEHGGGIYFPEEVPRHFSGRHRAVGVGEHEEDSSLNDGHARWRELPLLELINKVRGLIQKGPEPKVWIVRR